MHAGQVPQGLSSRTCTRQTAKHTKEGRLTHHVEGSGDREREDQRVLDGHEPVLAARPPQHAHELRECPGSDAAVCHRQNLRIARTTTNELSQNTGIQQQQLLQPLQNSSRKPGNQRTHQVERRAEQRAAGLAARARDRGRGLLLALLVQQSELRQMRALQYRDTTTAHGHRPPARKVAAQQQRHEPSRARGRSRPGFA